MPRQPQEASPFGCQLVHRVDEVAQIAAETIKFPHQRRVACPQGFQAADQSRLCVPATRCQIFIHVLGLNAGGRRIGLSTRGSTDAPVTEAPWLQFNPGIIDGVIEPGYYSLIQFKPALPVIDTATPSYTSFNGHKRIATGSLTVNALAVKHALASGVPGPLLTFCDQTGQVVDIDIRGSDAEMFARLPPEGGQLQGTESALIDSVESGEPRGRGRPKLGVVAREVTLLPRHWDWLAAQPGGASVTLRKLVDEARRANVDRDRQRQASECAYHFMSTMAGDMAGFEEASRALFANDAAKFRQLTEAWPDDVRDYVRCLGMR